MVVEFLAKVCKIREMERKSKILFYSLTLLAVLVYIVYRVLFTLPFELSFWNMFFGVLVLAIELSEAIKFVIFYFNTLCRSKKSPKTPKISDKDFPVVDVFIATVNESAELLTETITACKAMEYPDLKKVHIYICDDGNRKAIKTLAQKLNVKYITRNANTDYKAGNYNNAILNTESPYIATFDADMKPEKDFLLKTVPFFVKDEKVGFVQTPQSFKESDIFQGRLSNKIPFEQEYFYHYIQMARNQINSTILCGTNCVISRVAIEKVGRFATATVAEDIATGMLIESKGFKGIAIDSTTAYGESVTRLADFLKQRSRWGRGCYQTFKNYGFFWRKGLTWKQKFDYYVAINYWFYGVKHFAFMVLPFLFVFFNVIIVSCDLKHFLILFSLQYILRRFLIYFVDGRVRSVTWSKLCEVITMPSMTLEMLKEFFGFGSKKFVVTSKEKTAKREPLNFRAILTHFILLALSVFGCVIAIKNSMQWNTWVYIFSLFWLLSNILYLSLALLFDFRQYKGCNYGENRIKKYGIKAYVGLFRRGK